MTTSPSIKSMEIHYDSKHPKVTFDSANFVKEVDPTIKAFVPPTSIKKMKKREAKDKRPDHKK